MHVQYKMFLEKWQVGEWEIEGRSVEMEERKSRKKQNDEQLKHVQKEHYNLEQKLCEMQSIYASRISTHTTMEMILEGTTQYTFTNEVWNYFKPLKKEWKTNKALVLLIGKL